VTEPGDVAHLIGVVAHQHRLRAGHRHGTSADGQRGPAMAGQQLRQDLQRGTPLVVPVGRAAHHLRVGTERGVVDERPVTDDAQVDPLFHAVGERIQAGRRVLPVQPQVQREVVAGAGADHQERKSMLGGDPGHQRLGPVPARHAEQVRAAGHRLPGQRRHVYRARAVQQRHLRAQRFGLVLQPEPGDLPAPRPRVHDQERALRRRNLPAGHPQVADARGQRPPARARRQHDQCHRYQGDPQQPVQGKDHQHRGGGQDHHGEGHPPQHPAVREEHVPARQHQARAACPHGHHRHAGQVGETDQVRRRRQHQREGSPGQPATANDLARPHYHVGTVTGGAHCRDLVARDPGRRAVRSRVRQIWGNLRQVAVFPRKLVLLALSAVASDNGPGWDVSSQLGRCFPACALRPDMVGCLGFRRRRIARKLGYFPMSNGRSVRPAGFEPATRCLEGSCSVRLSYGRPKVIVHAKDHATATRGSQCVTPSKPYHLGKQQAVAPEDPPSVRAYLNLPSAIEPVEPDQLRNGSATAA
jgi:hypothetical protein